MSKKIPLFFCFLGASLVGCSGGLNLRDKIPDRRPDYRQSQTSHRLEVPPDLVSSSLSDQFAVPAFSRGESVSYQDYNPSHYKRNSRGYLDVLPQLYGVQVIEQKGELPYLLVNADPNVTWRAVKKYWENSGIRLKTQEPALGLMETDWLEDLSDLPKTGVSRFLDELIRLTHDKGKRDRYKIRFSRAGERTAVTVLYTQAEEKALGSRKDPAGFEWRISDNDNPELQLEMTRRLALFVSAELKRQAQQSDNPLTATRGVLSSINSQPVLILSQPYEQAWREIGTALDRAGLVLEHQNYKSGTYRVSYQDPTPPVQKGGLLSGILGEKAKPAPIEQYLIRLAAQGEHSLVVIQNTQQQAESAATAQRILTLLRDAL